MLGKILSKETCASCRFCCSFRKTSLLETPLFSKETKEKLSKLNNCKFKEISENHFTLQLENEYKTNEETEEAKCFFLDSNIGCILSEEDKPFDCKIWPLRIMKTDDEVFIAIAKGCPEHEKFFEEEAKTIFRDEIKPEILKKLSENPYMIKNFNNNYKKYDEC